MSYAIESQHVSKCYDLRGARHSQSTLIDSISGVLRAPTQWLRGPTVAGGRGADLFWALRDVSFNVEHGEAVGVIGRNGAGKSTLLKIFSRVTEPTSGRVVLRGRVASLLEVGTGFHAELSGRENIFLNGAILGMRRRETARRLDQIVEYAGVAKFLELPIKRYSSGMKMRLAFAVGAFLESEILIVDEVLAVGDATFQEKCLGTMRDAARGGRTVLFVSHNMVSIAALTRRCLLLDGGQVEFDGATGEAVRRYGGLKTDIMWQGLRPVSEIDCDRRWRGEVAARFVEIGYAPDQSEEISVGGQVRLQVVVEADTALEALRVGYSLNTREGRCVISGLSPLFSVVRGRSLHELTIDRVDLQPGEYDLSLSLGVGDWRGQKWEMDCLLGFGRLRITDAFVDGQPFGSWNTEWAPVLHRHCTLSAHMLAEAR
jgi:lipopolysaccharide transport system ATP-binding protein